MEKKSKSSEILTNIYASAIWDVAKYAFQFRSIIFSTIIEICWRIAKWGEGMNIVETILSFVGILFLVSASFAFYEKKIRKPKKIEKQETLLVTKENAEILGEGMVYNKFLLHVSNADKMFPVTKCHATLEYAADIFMGHDLEQQKGVLRVSNFVSKDLGNVDRVKWSDNYANEKHEREIPATALATLVLGDNLREFGYNLGSGKILSNFMLGAKLHIFKLRIDGLIRGESISRIFEGYIYFEKDGILFEEGDYKKDERIKEYLRKQ